MAKHKDFDLLKVLKSKKLSSEFSNQLGEAFVESVVQEIRQTIINRSDQEVSLDEWGGSEEWLPTVVAALINSTNGMTKYNSILNSMLTKPGLSLEMQDEFRRDTKAKISFNGDDSVGALGHVIETSITLTPSNNIDAEEMFKLLSATYFGADVEIPKKMKDAGVEQKTITVNATPGYNENKLIEASEKLRDYFVNNHERLIEGDLADRIKNELKNFKS